ncbi:hypothetical protein [Mesorhizobium salmacidum]|uniref:Uncharacterized protein n=1 Tax=Mesorhizobium salmacidum TaxID=3015171 RepID=A0ABU8L4G4_9HYPH
MQHLLKLGKFIVLMDVIQVMDGSDAGAKRHRASRPEVPTARYMPIRSTAGMASFAGISAIIDQPFCADFRTCQRHSAQSSSLVG